MSIQEIRDSLAGVRDIPAHLLSCCGRELLAGEVAAAGLDTRKRWYACKTGEHKAHCGCKVRK